MKAQKLGEMCFEVRCDYQASPNFEHKVVLQSDIHFDNPSTNLIEYERELSKAKDLGHGIVIVGDLFCAMQGNKDRRGSKMSLKDSHRVHNYYDKIVDEAVEFFAPYAGNILVIFNGNHETAVSKNNERDLIYNLVDKLQYKHGHEIQQGGYHGYIRWRFSMTNNEGVPNRTRTKTGYFHHGNWGGVISKGAQAVTRYSSMVPDADFVATGHTHDQWVMSHPQFRLKRSGAVEVHKQWHVKIGTFKEEFSKPNGWAIEKITMPKSIGGAEVVFSYDRKTEDIKINAHVK